VLVSFTVQWRDAISRIADYYIGELRVLCGGLPFSTVLIKVFLILNLLPNIQVKAATRFHLELFIKFLP